ncbi:CU044_5270 family protein [Microtetraspora malaysiensis]|uniref:CU044_5270 family protein n=1 Tax=Microtetraspora malaysiensis TaxID=161358 RepID=UPI0008366FCA|nr:CU044_5270 family protein [Microtetraspora malaysiensis]
MNDLDMVRDLRSQVRQSEESDLRGARRRVLASMARESRGRRLPRIVVRVAAVGILGVTITAGVMVVQTPRTDGQGKGAASAPAWLPVANVETLAKRATAAAARQTDVYPRADQWVYVKRDFYSSPKMLPESVVPPVGGGKTGSRYTAEMWTRGDGKERAQRNEGSKTITRRQGGEDPRLRFDPAYLRSLPLEPSALLERLKRDTAGVIPLPEMRAVSHQVLMILQEGAPAARLRAALYTVLSQLDDVGVEEVRDLLGREGVGIYTDDDEGIRQEVIIDPNTYVLLGGRRVYVGGSESQSPYSKLPKGEVVFSVAQVTAGIVDNAGGVP